MTIAAERLEVSAEGMLTHERQSLRRAGICSQRRLCVASVLVASLCSAIMGVGFGPLLFAADDQNIVTPLETNDRPIIGVLTIPSHADSKCSTRRLVGISSDGLAASAAEETSCFSSTYALWLAAAGARIVPIRYDLPAPEMERLMRKVNGLFFTGGDADLTDHGSTYMQSAKRIFEHVLETNRQGTRLPLWGTCMGFSLVNVLVGGIEVLEDNRVAEAMVIPLKFTAAADNSRLFAAKGGSKATGLLSSNIRKWFQTKNVSVHFHHKGISPATYDSNSNLKQFFNVLSTNVDANGRPFASTIEARDFPIFAAAYHPERPQFQFRDLFSPKDLLNHRREAVACNAYLAQAFVAEARQNSRNFSTQEEEDAALIDNYIPRGAISSQSYFFPKP